MTGKQACLQDLPKRRFHSGTAMPVPTGSYGVLDKGVSSALRFTSMETSRLFSCAALILASPPPDYSYLLAHLDGFFKDRLTGLKVRGAPQKFATAFVVYTKKADMDVVEAAISYAIDHTAPPGVIELQSDDTPAAIGVDVSGHLYAPMDPYVYYERGIRNRTLATKLHGSPTGSGREVVNMTYFFAMRRRES